MNADPRKCFLVLLSLALLLAAPRWADADEGKYTHGLLWKVSKHDGRPNYLFGTIHTDDLRVTHPPPEVERAFDHAKIFVAELIDEPEAGPKFRSAMVTREPQLPGLLGKTAYARVDELLGDHGVPEEARPRFKPWAALLTLLQPTAVNGEILDHLLLAEAAEQKKTIRALETLDEQIAVFDEMPRESQLALLNQAAAGYAEIQKTVGPLVDAYLRRDLQAIWRLNSAAMAGTPEMRPHNDVFLERVLYQRNQRFVQRLEPLLEQGNAFAAFGALHLYGPRGVLSLLAKEGFSVQRIY